MSHSSIQNEIIREDFQYSSFLTVSCKTMIVMRSLLTTNIFMTWSLKKILNMKNHCFHIFIVIYFFFFFSFSFSILFFTFSIFAIVRICVAYVRSYLSRRKSQKNELFFTTRRDRRREFETRTSFSEKLTDEIIANFVFSIIETIFWDFDRSRSASISESKSSKLSYCSDSNTFSFWNRKNEKSTRDAAFLLESFSTASSLLNRSRETIDWNNDKVIMSRRRLSARVEEDLMSMSVLLWNW